MAQTPAWATDLVSRVARDYGIDPPALTWRRSRTRTYSSGHFSPYSRDPESTLVRVGKDGRERTYPGWGTQPRIVVTAGRDRPDQKHTILHEMAHAITTDRPNLLHGPEFYAVVGELLLRYGGTLKHLRRIEGWGSLRKSIDEGLRLMRQRREASSV